MAEYQGIVERQPNTGPRLPEPNRLSADRGWHWIMDAFRLVKPHFGVWFLLCLIFFIIMMVMSAVPAGSFVWMLLQPILGAGLMFACSELERVRVAHVPETVLALAALCQDEALADARS